MEEASNPQGEFHHFQLVNQEGDIPLSISVLVHYNQRAINNNQLLNPITADEVIAFHEDLQKFDGDFTKAFRKK